LNSLLLLRGYFFTAKGEQQETGATSKSKKVRTSLWQFFCFIYLCCLWRLKCLYFRPFFLQRRKTGNKPRDASTPHGSTAAESVRNLIKKNPKYSKRINYDALKDLFVDGGVPSSLPINTTLGVDDKDDDDKDDGLYTIGLDDKSDGEGTGMVIIQEEPGVVSVTPASGSRSNVPGLEEDNMNADADGDEGSEKGDDLGWEDVYEQEV
jgi:transcription factor IIIB subunit 2